MIKYSSQTQISIKEFKLPFGGQLSPENRWVTLARILPWDEMVSIYIRKMSRKMGRKAIDPRVAVGSLIIKHLKALSDDDTVEEIRENPYLQYFLGYCSYSYDPPFTSSLFVLMRRRLGEGQFNELSRQLAAYIDRSSKKPGKRKPRSDSGDPTSDGGRNESEPLNKGHLVVDASVAPADIKYPTDLDLLNEIREKSELLIDQLHRPGSGRKKPRTYRRVARRHYLGVSRSRRKTRKSIRKALGKQLRYISRNMKSIEKLLDECGSQSFPLSHTYQRLYWIIGEVYRQQRMMYENRSHQVSDRIVSVSQPHVRPIVRGKSGKEVEFGAKISLSLVDGMSYLHRISWDAYNESGDLKDQIETYHSQFGYYPQWVSADKIYGTRENRSYMRSRNIRFTGVPLGRRRELTQEVRRVLKEHQRFNRQRSRIEGKFGEAKRKYDLGLVKAKKRDTSESWIQMVVLVMNIAHLLRVIFLSFLKFIHLWLKKTEWMPFNRKSSVLQIG